MKQNSCPIVSEVSKSTGIGLDELDGTIEAFSAGVADSVLAVAPELSEVFLDASGPAGLQVELGQSPKRNGFSATTVWVLSQPRPHAALQQRRASLGQAAVFLFSHRIYRLTKVLGGKELVMQDIGLGHAWPGRTHIRRPHVHCHRLERLALRLCERLHQPHRRFKLSLRHQVQHLRAVNHSEIDEEPKKETPCWI